MNFFLISPARTVRNFILSLSGVIYLGAGASFSRAETPEPPVVNQYVSVGDNWYLGRAMAVDSEASIRDTFKFFKAVFNTKRIYWRGLQAAIAVDQLGIREDNFMYAGAFRHFEDLIDSGLERKAVEIAHDEGLEIWGLTQFGDYGVTADTPNFNEYPGFWEAKLRQENPEWVPVDKYGYRKQGGVIELAYPEARKALVDLHVKLVKEAGYDGIAFMSYAENFSMRFQDEFGYSEPIVDEFKRRYGIDIRTEEFTKYASKEDWYRLRGEYITAFLKELGEALGEDVKIGVFLNPINPRLPMVWATLPQEFYTLGMIHMDVDRWIRDGIVDELGVYGGSSTRAQDDTINEMLFLSRGFPVEITFITSSPYAMDRWAPYYEMGMSAICSLGEEIQYLERCLIPKQTESALKSGTIYEQMRFLSQVIEGHATCSSDLVLPLLKSDNIVMRRLALQALGKLKDPATIPAIENALNDPEQGVRSMAVFALGNNQRPESFDAILECMDKTGNHALLEMTRNAIPRFSPVPYEKLHAALKHPNPMVRRMAMYSLRFSARPDDLPQIEEALNDEDRYVAFLAAASLGLPQVSNHEPTQEVLLKNLQHPDLAVRNRIAISVGELVNRGYTGPLREAYLNALKENLLEFGTDTERSDVDWGYRAIGDALLGFGPEGEAVLEEVKRTAPDPRVQELAWQILAFREKTSPFSNAFNIITEKESDEAFRARPISMKTQQVDLLSQGFEDRRVFKADDSTSASLGSVDGTGGRWGGFGADGALITSTEAKSGAQSLKLKRGGNQMLVWMTNGPQAGWDFGAELWLKRNLQGSASIHVRDQANQDFIALMIGPDGSLKIANPEGNPAWSPTDLVVPADAWVRLSVLVEASAGTAQFEIADEAGTSLGSASVNVEFPKTSPTRILFSPNAPAESEVTIDDVRLFEVR